MLSVPRIKEFLNERLPLLLKINVEDLKRRGASVSELVQIDEPEDYEQAYHELLQFVRDLVHFCRLEFYNVRPHDVPALRNLYNPGRPKGARNKSAPQPSKMISGKAKKEKAKLTEEEQELLDSIPTTEEEVKVAEWGMKQDKEVPVQEVKVKPGTSYTEEIMCCDTCGFMGNFVLVKGFPVCSSCGHNHHA